MLYMIITVAIVGVSVALMVREQRAMRAFLVSSTEIDADETPHILAQYEGRISALEGERDLLRTAVAEGISHVERVENRIRGTIRRAKSELEEHGIESPGLEAEARELQLVDAPRSTAETMPQVYQDVVPSGSSVPGVTQEQLAKVRGYG